MKRPQKICENCHKPFWQKIFSSGEIESASCMKRRKYCSMTCTAIKRERKRKAETVTE